MSEYIKVDGHSTLLSDEHSTAIVSNDTNSYELYKRRRETFKVQKNDVMKYFEREMLTIGK